MTTTRTREDEEEERRLFYVAVTRAKDELALTYPLISSPRDGERMILRVSRFIDELPADPDAPYDRLILESVQTPEGALPSLGAGGDSSLEPEVPDDLEGA
jgi:DNA helicase-2/ATP-dependent DNA helicase PcrA